MAGSPPPLLSLLLPLLSLLPMCLSSCLTDPPSPSCLAGQFSAPQSEVETLLAQLAKAGPSVTQSWLKAVLKPKRTLLVIDMQNDFITGSLKVGGANDIVAPIQGILDDSKLWDKIIFSKDWHPKDHISFFSNYKLRELDPTWRANHPGNISMFQEVVFAREPPYKQVLWPDHCVQGSAGSDYQPDLVRPAGAQELRKGTNPEVDSYSAFYDNTGIPGSGSTGLTDMVAGSTEIVVVGLATDYCVGSTSLHAIQEGFPTTLLRDLARPVSEETGKAMEQKVEAARGWVENSSDWKKSLDTWERARKLGAFLLGTSNTAVTLSMDLPLALTLATLALLRLQL